MNWLLLHDACAGYTNSHRWQEEMAHTPDIPSATWPSWINQYLTSAPDMVHCLFPSIVLKSSIRKQRVIAAVRTKKATARGDSGFSSMATSLNRSLENCDTWRTWRTGRMCSGSTKGELTALELKMELKMEGNVEVITAMEVKWGFQFKGRRRSNQTRDAQIYREKIDDWVGRAGRSSVLIHHSSCTIDKYNTEVHTRCRRRIPVQSQ